jgi:CRP-like cAMP-binding protein
VSFHRSVGLPMGSPTHYSEDWQHRFLEVSRPGQMSGELGLFTKELRKYTLVAVEPCVIWTVDTGALNAMMTKDPQCYIVLLRLALRYASHRLHSLMLVGQLHSV